MLDWKNIRFNLLIWKTSVEQLFSNQTPKIFALLQSGTMDVKILKSNTDHWTLKQNCPCLTATINWFLFENVRIDPKLMIDNLRPRRILVWKQISLRLCSRIIGRNYPHAFDVCMLRHCPGQMVGYLWPSMMLSVTAIWLFRQLQDCGGVCEIKRLLMKCHLEGPLTLSQFGSVVDGLKQSIRFYTISSTANAIRFHCFSTPAFSLIHKQSMQCVSKCVVLLRIIVLTSTQKPVASHQTVRAKYVSFTYCQLYYNCYSIHEWLSLKKKTWLNPSSVFTLYPPYY